MPKNTPQVLLTKESSNVYIIYVKPFKSNILSLSLVEEIRDIQDEIASELYNKKSNKDTILLWVSANDNCLSLNFDMNYIKRCIRKPQYSDVEYYIERFLDIIYLNYFNLSLPLLNVSYLHGVHGFLSNHFMSSISINLMSSSCNENYVMDGIFRDKNPLVKISSYASLEELSNIILSYLHKDKTDFFIPRNLRIKELSKLFQRIADEKACSLINSKKVCFKRSNLDYLKSKVLRHYDKFRS